MATVKRGGLGRGLNTLIPTDDNTKRTKSSEKPEVKEIIKEVEQTLGINEIEPNKDQPRKNFDEDALAELADSIKQYGVIEPIVVVKQKNYYQIIAGERRWRAARMAGLKEVPVVIKKYNEQERLEVGLIENLQRENLNPIEEAQAYQQLVTIYGLKQDEVAEKVSKSRTAITNALRLLKLTDKVQQMLVEDMLSVGHVRTLITIEDPDLQYEAALNIFDKNLNVRETEKYVKSLLTKGTKPSKKNEETEDLSFLYKDIEEKLKSSLGTKATIKAKDANRGKIEIEYYNKEDLEKIVNLLYAK